MPCHTHCHQKNANWIFLELAVKKRLKYFAKCWRVELRENRDNFFCVSRYDFLHVKEVLSEIHCNLSSFFQILPSYKVIFVVINFSHFFPDSIKDKWNIYIKKSNKTEGRKERSHFWVNQLRNFKEKNLLEITIVSAVCNDYSSDLFSPPFSLTSHEDYEWVPQLLDICLILYSIERQIINFLSAEKWFRTWDVSEKFT